MVENVSAGDVVVVLLDHMAPFRLVWPPDVEPLHHRGHHLQLVLVTITLHDVGNGGAGTFDHLDVHQRSLHEGATASVRVHKSNRCHYLNIFVECRKKYDDGNKE